jgi:hypothetical protein
MQRLRTPSALLLAAALAAALAGAAPAAAQDLPRVPERGGCRSEMAARLAFGMCPDSTYDFYAGGSFREGVPRPEQVLGYPIGSWHTTYGRMERYLDALGRAVPGRVKVMPYGRSVEHQTMYLVAVSSEANVGRLDAVRADLQALADPRRTSAAEAAEIARRTPIAVWINAANDGNETAAFEAAIQLAYQLAAGEDDRTRAMRDGALVLINLAHNPESHERHVAWYNGFVTGDADPAAMEHRAPWGMSTNNNHYQFDLNRDALGLVQTESRAVAAELQRWRPQVFADLHGQTTQYFFPPAADPVNPFLPAQTEKWLETFGRGNAAAFDRQGWSYFTRDVFDLHYPGYWDSYPSFQGATGMTYETDGGGSKGVRWRRDDGTILTFADGIAGHFVASLATIETAVRNRESRMRDFHEFFASAVAEGSRGPLRTVVLTPGRDPRLAAKLATTLLRHGVEVRRVVSGGRVSGTEYATGARGSREVPAGSYLVDLAQPMGRLARVLLAPETPLPASFTRQENERRARNARRAEGEQEGYAFYDVTAWNLPMAHGASGFWTGDRVGTCLRAAAARRGGDEGAGRLGGRDRVGGPRRGGGAGGERLRLAGGDGRGHAAPGPAHGRGLQRGRGRARPGGGRPGLPPRHLGGPGGPQPPRAPRPHRRARARGGGARGRVAERLPGARGRGDGLRRRAHAAGAARRRAGRRGGGPHLLRRPLVPPGAPHRAALHRGAGHGPGRARAGRVRRAGVPRRALRRHGGQGGRRPRRRLGAPRRRGDRLRRRRRLPGRAAPGRRRGRRAGPPLRRLAGGGRAAGGGARPGRRAAPRRAARRPARTRPSRCPAPSCAGGWTAPTGSPSATTAPRCRCWCRGRRCASPPPGPRRWCTPPATGW